MVSARAIGLMLNDPQRGHAALHAVRGALKLPANADAVGVASCVDGSVLLTRRPSLPPGTDLARLTGPLKGRTALVQLRIASELRPPRAETTTIGPFRSRQLACAVVGGPQDPDRAAQARERWVAALPDFLRRNVGSNAEGEAFFFAIVAELHKLGVVDRGAPPPPETVVAAIRAVLALDDKTPRHVMFATGADVVHVSRGFDNAIIRLDGIAEEVAADLDPTLADSSIARERLRRFRALIALGALDMPFEDTRGLPAGATIARQATDCAVILGKDLELRTL
jgi:hypothetical protein